MKRNRKLTYWTIGIILILSAVVFLWIFFGLYNYFGVGRTEAEQAIARKLKREQETAERLHFELLDPAQAPKGIRDIVQFGYLIMLDTPKYASQYIGDRLSCTHCHFAGGNTTGGKNGGISLAGVAAIYPRYDERSGKVIDLPTRINSCFMRSMNGKPLPLDSNEMLALVTYLQWISHGVPIYQPVPWLSMPPLPKTQVSNSQNGKRLYALRCATCHGSSGEGEVRNDIPPVWGPKSFNDSAGMNSKSTMAAFIYYNMPYTDAALSIDQAWDIAAYIAEQHRPHFEPKKEEQNDQ